MQKSITDWNKQALLKRKKKDRINMRRSAKISPSSCTPSSSVKSLLLQGE